MSRERPSSTTDQNQKIMDLKRNLDLALHKIEADQNYERAGRILPWLQEQIAKAESTNPGHPDLPAIRQHYSNLRQLAIQNEACPDEGHPLFYGINYMLDLLDNVSQLETTPNYRDVDSTEARNLVSEEPSDEFVIHRLSASTQPEIKHDYRKEYIIFHGSAGSDESLIESGQSSSNFAYGILRNGTIIEFFPSNLGQGGAGPYAMLNGDPLVNFKGIGIELSLQDHPTLDHEVEDPTPEQLAAARKLENWLSLQHNIPRENVSTSAQTVTRDGDMIKGLGAHGDTRTWRDRPDLLNALGIDVENFSRQDSCPPDPGLVREKIDLSRSLRDRYTSVRDRAENSIEYWAEVLESLNS